MATASVSPKPPPAPKPPPPAPKPPAAPPPPPPPPPAPSPDDVRTTAQTLSRAGMPPNTSPPPSDKPPATDPPAPITVEPLEPQNEDGVELNKLLKQQNTLLHRLGGKYDSQAANLGAQDVPFPEPTNNEGQYIERVKNFLNEVSEDMDGYKMLQSGNKALSDELTSTVDKIDALWKKNSWTIADMETLAGDEMSLQDTAWDSYAKSAGILADMSKSYVNKMDRTAAGMSHAWDQTIKNERTTAMFSNISLVVDLLTSFGIGGNAVSQLVAKEFKEVAGTFDRVTNATWLRGGQLGDLGQAAGNAGYNIRNFNSSSASGMAGEIQGNTDNAGHHLNALYERMKKYQADYEEEIRNKPDPNPFVPI